MSDQKPSLCDVGLSFSRIRNESEYHDKKIDMDANHAERGDGGARVGGQSPSDEAIVRCDERKKCMPERAWCAPRARHAGQMWEVVEGWFEGVGRKAVEEGKEKPSTT